jgi:light-regulated signal transduction histidine kinase (bacteriophytochrome)
MTLRHVQVREGNLEPNVLGDLLANIVYMLHNCTTLVDACSVITRSLKQASGFSRVMIYKFHPYVIPHPGPHSLIAGA